MYMKKFALAGSALVAALTVASAAQAADMAVPVTYDWTGFYIGANAGVAWNNSSVDNHFYVDGIRLGDIENRIDGDQTAFTAGGLIGYNHQIDNIVLGVEADLNYLGFGDDNKRSGVLPHPGAPLDLESKGSFEADWFGTLRGRLGFAIDNVLLYGTGGLAYGHMSADGKITASVRDQVVDTWKASTESTNWGWTIGGGMEYGIDNWSLGIEYLYVDLGDGEWDNGSFDNAHDYKLSGDADYAFSTVRATAKIRF